MTSWGWRIPFLLALPFGAVGLYIRWKLDETSEFLALAEQGQVAKSSIRDTLRSSGRVILSIAAISAFQNVGYYTAYAYFSGYMHRLGFGAGAVSTATTVTLIVAAASVPVFGRLSDAIGRRKILLAASGTALVVTVPLFALMGTLGYGGVLVCQIVLALTVAAYNSTTSATYAEMSEARTRAGSVTIGFNLGSLIFAAPTLYVMTLIETKFSVSWAPGIYMAIAALISVVAVVGMSRSSLGRAVHQ